MVDNSFDDERVKDLTNRRFLAHVMLGITYFSTCYSGFSKEVVHVAIELLADFDDIS